MTPVEKIVEYLDKANIFYVTTVEGDQPKCRPFSFKMVFNDKIYFGVGTFKDCYQQLEKNPNVEICASDGKGFLRYYGKAVFDENPEIVAKAYELAPFLSNLYNESTGRVLGMFTLADATAEFRSLMGVEETFSL